MPDLGRAYRTKWRDRLPTGRGRSEDRPSSNKARCRSRLVRSNASAMRLSASKNLFLCGASEQRNDARNESQWRVGGTRRSKNAQANQHRRVHLQSLLNHRTVFSQKCLANQSRAIATSIVGAPDIERKNKTHTENFYFQYFIGGFGVEFPRDHIGSNGISSAGRKSTVGQPVPPDDCNGHHFQWKDSP